jgi:hypothetical protein
MNLFLQLVVLGNLIQFISAQKNFEEAKTIIQDYVKSYGIGKDLCDKYTCCSLSSTESCSITNFKKDDSTLVLPGGNTRCIFSDSTPYAFQVNFSC